MSKTKVNVPVFMFLVNDKDEVYLQRRFQTGFFDGYYEPPAGGLEVGEFPQVAACREVLEEAGVKVDSKDVELFHTFLNFNTEDDPFFGLFFRTRTWTGVPRIMEPALCDDAGFFPLDRLPEKMLPQARDAAECILSAPSIDLSNYTSLKQRVEEQMTAFDVGK